MYGFTAVKRKKQENYFKDKVFIFRVQSLILEKYSPGLLNFWNFTKKVLTV